MSQARAWRFLAAQQGLLGPAPAADPWTLGALSYDVVEPLAAPVGTILSVHGMSPLAQRDPRMVRLHGALAAIGFRVVAPHLRSVAGLRIHAGQIDTIEAAIASVAGHRGLCPSGRLSLFAPSFSGGLSLIAAARPSVADRVRAVLLLGAYGNIRTAMDAVLTRRDLNPYAWKIVLANFVECVERGRPAVRKALLVAALDEWHTDRLPQLPAFLDTLDPDDARRVETLLLDRDARLALWRAILDADPPFLTFGNTVDQLDGLRARVTLVHGEHDPTIPARQSHELHRALREVGHPSRLLVTPALGHGGAASTWTLARRLPDLTRAFGAFFEEATAGADTAPRLHGLVGALA